MQQKIIKIPFNNKFFLESHKAIWAFSGSKSFVRNISFTVLGVFLLAVNWMLERRGGFPLGTMIAGGYFAYMLMFWIGRFERRVKFFNKVKKQAIRFEEEAMETAFIFSENSFEYTDREKSFKLAWSLFKPIVLYKDNIFLTLKDSGTIFSLGRSELGDIEYNEVCDILKSKIG